MGKTTSLVSNILPDLGFACLCSPSDVYHFLYYSQTELRRSHKCITYFLLNVWGVVVGGHQMALQSGKKHSHWICTISLHLIHAAN